MEVEYDDSKEDQNVSISKLLNYPSAADDLYPPRVEDPITEDDAAADDAVRMMSVLFLLHGSFSVDQRSLQLRTVERFLDQRP